MIQSTAWEDILKKYINKHSKEIRRTTKPLRDHLGIEYFTYHQIDNSGNYKVLVDRPDWAEHYVSEQFFLNDPYLRHPSVYRSGLCLMQSHGSQAYKDTVLKTGQEKFSFEEGVILIQRNDNFVEFFGFCSAKKGLLTACINLYISDITY